MVCYVEVWWVSYTPDLHITDHINILNFESNHPVEHKSAAFRHHITRMHLLQLTAEKKTKNGR
jgi:hypothetical protein